MSSASIDARLRLIRLRGDMFKSLVGWASAAITLSWSSFSALAAVYDSDGSSTNVQYIHDTLAQNGDTIVLPAGTFTWATRVNINKAITLEGAGVGSTVVRDGVQSGQLIQWTLAANYPSRITGIEFQDGGGSQKNAPGGIIHIDGSNMNGSTFRFDHNKLNNVNGQFVNDTVIGVVDHNTFVIDRLSPPLDIYGTRWDGQDNGDGSWAAPTGFGSSQFLFIEDNVFTTDNPPPAQKGVTDAYNGARFIFRYNEVHDGVVTNHGTESTGRGRGCRAMEIYNNNFIGTNLNKFIGGSRSGVVLMHENSISGYWDGLTTFSLENYRTHMTFAPWSGADGTNAWDVNSATTYFTGMAA